MNLKTGKIPLIHYCTEQKREKFYMNDKNMQNNCSNLVRKDLTALHGMLGDETTFDDAIFGFHAQQTVEKSLKALLSNKEVEFKKDA